MDIRGWLANTVDRQPPDDDQDRGYQHDFPEFLQPRQHPHEKTNAPKNTGVKRKHAYGDPPTTHQRARRRHGQASITSASSDQSQSTEGASTSSTSSCNSVSKRTGRERLSSPSCTYERRPRRKTRPEIYESKPKNGKNDRRSRKETKPKSKSQHRKRRKTADGARTSDLVRSFKLRSGSKGNRLTLRPDLSTGIFKHGRSSTRVAAKGPGLPDLVFNEMKFLQRPKEHQDTLPVEQGEKHSAKKSKKQLQEEEISSYFAKKPPQVPISCRLGESPNGTANDKRTLNPSTEPNDNARQERHEAGHGLEQQFLGFGRIGPTKERPAERAPSNTCYTWSETTPTRISSQPPNTVNNGSIRQRSLPGSNMPIVRECDQVNRAASRRTESGVDPTPAAGQCRANVQNRVRASKDQALAETIHEHPGATVSSEFPRGAARERSGGICRSNHSSMTSFRTSDILKIRKSGHSKRSSSSLPGHDPWLDAHSNKENTAPLTSTPASPQLRDAFHQVAKTRSETEREQSVLDPLAGMSVFPWFADQVFMGHAVEEANNVLETICRSTALPAFGELPERNFSRATDSSRLRGHRSPSVTAASAYKPGQGVQAPPFSHAHAVRHGMQDSPTAVRLPRMHGAYSFPNGREVDESVRRLAADQEPSFFNARSNHLDGVSDTFFSRAGHTFFEGQPELVFAGNANMMDLTTEPAPGNAQVLDDELASEIRNDEVNEDVQEMMRFWRPNMLY